MTTAPGLRGPIPKGTQEGPGNCGCGCGDESGAVPGSLPRAVAGGWAECRAVVETGNREEGKGDDDSVWSELELPVGQPREGSVTPSPPACACHLSLRRLSCGLRALGTQPHVRCRKGEGGCPLCPVSVCVAGAHPTEQHTHLSPECSLHTWNRASCGST